MEQLFVVLLVCIYKKNDSKIGRPLNIAGCAYKALRLNTLSW